MQQLTSRPQPGMYPNRPPHHGSTGNTSDRSTIVLITALILFAIAGLLSGFAIGAINRPHHTQTANNTHGTQQNQPNVPSKTGGTTQKTPTITIVPIGCPVPDAYVPIETADGQTPYTVSAYATTHSNDPRSCGGNQLTDAGITFKLWLTQSIPDPVSVNFPQGSQSVYTNINSPLTGTATKQGKTTGNIPEVQGLQFASTSPQVQQSNAQGRVTWKYTLPTSLQPGNYELFVLVDWQGKEYNWSWRNITIQKAR